LAVEYGVVHAPRRHVAILHDTAAVRLSLLSDALLQKSCRDAQAKSRESVSRHAFRLGKENRRISCRSLHEHRRFQRPRDFGRAGVDAAF
jgi:hypothetical protein